MAVLLLLPSALDEGLEVAVLVRVCVTEPGALLGMLLLDVDEGGNVSAVVGKVLEEVSDVVCDVGLSDKDVAGDAVSAIDNAAKELMTGAAMVPLPLPQLQVSSPAQQN